MNYKQILEGMTPEQRQSTEAVIEYARARVTELEKEKAELQKDRERLDWLANNGRDFVPVISRRMNMRMSLRQAIDNARGEDE